MFAPYNFDFCVSGKERLAMSAIRNAQRIGIKPSILIAEYTADDFLEKFCYENEVIFVRIPKLPRVDFDQMLYESCTKQVLGYASLIVSLWVLAGLLIFIMGVVGLYVGKCFEGVKRRPAFIIAEIRNE